MNKFEHPLARARGAGASGDGVGHWQRQRFTAAALLPLHLWFVFAFTGRLGAGYSNMLAWLSQPLVGLAALLYLGLMFYHAALGLQVVIEDYVPRERGRGALIALMQLALAAAGAAAIFSVLRIVL